MRIAALLCAVLICSVARADAAGEAASQLLTPTTPQAWSMAAKRDIELTYQIYLANHPGVFNTEDPQFAVRLAVARKNALTLAAQVKDAGGFSAAIDRFSAGLRDGHALAYMDVAQSAADRWPGFVAAWRGEGLYVYASTLPEIKAGDEILACDHRSANTLMLQNVFRFGGRPDEAGQWWSQARNLFVDGGNPFVRLPKRCTFRTGDHVATIDITWRQTDANYETWRKASYNGDVLKPGLTEPRPKLFWVAMPTFEPDDVARDAYRKAIDTLRDRRSEILSADAIVIDLRNNQGGSSFWSEALAQSLWGAGRIDRLRASWPSRVWWRASEDNTNYVESLVAKFRADGQPESASSFASAATGMRNALRHEQRYYVEPLNLPSLSKGADPAPLMTPVYVIVPGQCASACLDALDVFTHFPNTKLIGAPSSADTVYLEIRSQTLPDGLVKVVIPNKLYRNRPRAAGYYYRPAIEVDDLVWSTHTFVDVVETDLKRGRRAAGRNQVVQQSEKPEVTR